MMETLPVEMVNLISNLLTPQDLSRCCAVSRAWREAFNQDFLWKPLCDVDLEEPLRYISSTVEPVFVVLEEKETFLPVSRWRLAYARERHLWRNWMVNNVNKEVLSMPVSSKSFVSNIWQNFKSLILKNATDLREVKFRRTTECLFLTDTLLVGWYSSGIVVWDVSLNPAVCIIKTDHSVHVESWDSISLVGGNNLVVKQFQTVEVYAVDLMNKNIKLKHKILLDQADFIVNKSVGLAVCGKNRVLKVYDLIKGMKIKDESCPYANETATIIKGMKTSPLSDDVLILFQNCENTTAYVYSTDRLCYLSGPHTVGGNIELNKCAINKNWVALSDELGGLLIVDYLKSEIIFKNEKKNQAYTEILPLLGYKNDFIFLKHINWNYKLQSFSLLNKMITTICKQSRLPHYNDCCLDTINNRFVVVFECIADDIKSVKSVFEPSGTTLRQINMIGPRLDERFNSSFTRSYRYDYEGNLEVLHYW